MRTVGHRMGGESSRGLVTVMMREFSFFIGRNFNKKGSSRKNET